MKESCSNRIRFVYVLKTSDLVIHMCKYDIVTLTLSQMLPHDITDK